MTKPSLVQVGWRIHSSDGVILGSVVDASGDSLLIGDEEGARWWVPKEDIAEEEEQAMRATLSIDAEHVRPADAGTSGA